MCVVRAEWGYSLSGADMLDDIRYYNYSYYHSRVTGKYHNTEKQDGKKKYPNLVTVLDYNFQ